MTQPLPPPPVNPLQRLHVTEGLLVNADRWRLAHDYHRQRQRLHYQALNQPGIVCGLGVQVIPPPANLQLRPEHQNRWVQIQPGMAIDVAGNPIIIPEPVNYRIAAEPSHEDALVVYVVVRYVDTLIRKDNPDIAEETFRIDEKTSPPDEWEVEICRLRLKPETKVLNLPQDVFAPGDNTLDLRFRSQVQVRPQAIVRAAQVIHPDPDHAPASSANLAHLMAALPTLYPALGAELGQVHWQEMDLGKADYDWLYLTGRRALNLSEHHVAALKQYFWQGGMVLVDVPTGGADLAKSVMSLAQDLGMSLDYWENLPPNHPLRCQPFVFAAPPFIRDQAIRVLVGGNIVMTIGELAAGWGLDDQFVHSRDAIRNAQEFGINLLQFAQRRRSMTTLLGVKADEEEHDRPLTQAWKQNLDSATVPGEARSTPLFPSKPAQAKPVHAKPKSVLDQFIDRDG